MEIGKSLEEYFVEASPKQREAVRMLLKEKAGYPTRRKRQAGSDSEPDSKPSWIPHKTCDNCALSTYKQDSNDPHSLIQGCPFYSIRKHDARLERMVCLKWANRKFASMETDDGDGIEEG